MCKITRIQCDSNKFTADPDMQTTKHKLKHGHWTTIRHIDMFEKII